MTEINFTVLGDPHAQKRHRTRLAGGRAMQYDPDKGKKADFLAAVQQHAPAYPLEGPIRLDVIAYFGRPKSHYKTGKNSGILKENAPTYHISRPDRDNIEKFIMDSLNKIYWKDDSQICCGEIIKMYTTGTPRVSIYIQTVQDIGYE